MRALDNVRMSTSAKGTMPNGRGCGAWKGDAPPVESGPRQEAADGLEHLTGCEQVGGLGGVGWRRRGRHSRIWAAHGAERVAIWTALWAPAQQAHSSGEALRADARPAAAAALGLLVLTLAARTLRAAPALLKRGTAARTGPADASLAPRGKEPASEGTDLPIDALEQRKHLLVLLDAPLPAAAVRMHRRPDV